MSAFVSLKETSNSNSQSASISKGGASDRCETALISSAEVVPDESWPLSCKKSNWYSLSGMCQLEYGTFTIGS